MGSTLPFSHWSHIASPVTSTGWLNQLSNYLSVPLHIYLFFQLTGRLYVMNSEVNNFTGKVGNSYHDVVTWLHTDLHTYTDILYIHYFNLILLILPVLWHCIWVRPESRHGVCFLFAVTHCCCGKMADKGEESLWSILIISVKKISEARINDSSFPALQLRVPKGSLLLPFLRKTHMKPLEHIVKWHRLQCHQYPDDTKLYVSFSLKPYVTASLCLAEIRHGWKPVGWAFSR